MANEQNLRNIDEYNKSLTHEERTRNASKAGKASVLARQEKKLIKDRILEKMGEKDWDEYIQGIIDRSKESRADAEFLRDTIGQKPIDKHEIAGSQEEKDNFDALIDTIKSHAKDQSVK